MSKLIDLAGQRFGKLTVITRSDNNKQGQATWLCRCDCGVLTKPRGADLRNKHTISCGCFKKELATKMNTTHNAHKSGAYNSWKAMKQRCLNHNHDAYCIYGDNGITICPEWIHSFQSFLNDMGERPDKHTIERKNNLLGYYKENCKWADRTEQANNTKNCKFIIHNGVTMSCAMWSASLGGSHSLVSNRLKRGWSEQKAVTTPAKRNIIELPK